MYHKSYEVVKCFLPNIRGELRGKRGVSTERCPFCVQEQRIIAAILLSSLRD